MDAVEFQQSSGFNLDTKTLSMSTSTDIRICSEDMWKALRGLLGIQSYGSAETPRKYLGAPHPLFQDTQNIYDAEGNVIGTERVPMMWADSVNLAPMDDWYKGTDGEDIELSPYFGGYEEISKRIPIKNPNIFLPSSSSFGTILRGDFLYF